jgi:integrase
MDLVAAIFAEENTAQEPEARVKFLRFLYAVGPRKGQVLATRAEQLTPATGMMHWTDEDTKQEQPHIVTYTGEALEILLWFVAHRDPVCPALFQEDGEPLTIYKLKTTWDRLCERAGLALGRKNGGYTIHNLRHTYVSEAHEAGESAGVIMAMTGHLHEPTMLHYLRVSGKAQQGAQERLEAHRREQAEKVKASKVVRLVGRRGA